MAISYLKKRQCNQVKEVAAHSVRKVDQDRLRMKTLQLMVPSKKERHLTVSPFQKSALMSLGKESGRRVYWYSVGKYLIALMPHICAVGKRYRFNHDILFSQSSN